MKISEKKTREIIKMIFIESGIRDNGFIEEDRIIDYCKNAGITRKTLSEIYYSI